MKWLITAVWCIPLIIYTEGKGVDELGAMLFAWFLCAVGAVVTAEILGVDFES